MSRTLEPTRVALSLADEAERCRAAGHYATAAELFALAGEQATTVGERLHLQMRLPGLPSRPARVPSWQC